MKNNYTILLALILFTFYSRAQSPESPCSLQAKISVGICIDYFCIPVYSNVTGGTAPYQYQWFNGDKDDDTSLDYGSDPTGLDTCLTLTVTDAEGCVVQASFRYIYEAWPAYPQTTITLVNDTITIGLSGGSIDIRSNDQADAQNYILVQPPKHGDLQLLPDGTCNYVPHPSWCGPDNFRYTATDSSHCHYGQTTTVLIDQAPCANIIVHTFDCNQSCSGSASFYQNNVLTPPLTYQWSDGSTDSKAIHLCEGPVTVTVTDALGTIEIYTADISSSVLEATLSGPVVICNQNQVLLDAEISTQNVSAYSYYWTGPGVYGSISFDLPISPYCSVSTESALYKLHLQSAEGCNVTAEWNIEVHPQVSFNLLVNLPKCPGDTLEMTTEINHPGTPPYKYAWSGPNGVQSNWQKLIWPDMTSAYSGHYAVTITDDNGCYHHRAKEIVIPDTCKYILSMPDIGRTVCTGSEMELFFGLQNSWVVPDRVEWTGPNGFYSNALSPVFHNAQPNLTGWYYLTIQIGSKVMTDSAYYTVTSEALYFTDIDIVPPIDCIAPNDGAVTFHVNAPPPYEVRYNTYGSYLDVTTNPFVNNNVRSGNLFIEILKEGCHSVKHLTIDTLGDPEIIVQHESCAGGDASIEVTSENPISVRWTLLDGSFYDNDQTILPDLSPGHYGVLVTDDSTRCKFNRKVQILPYLDFKVAVVDTPSCISADGSMLATASGNATPPLLYEWNNGFIGNPITGLGQGGYSVTLTDAEGCSRHQNTVLGAEEACIAQVSGHVYINTTCQCDLDSTTVIFPFTKICATNGTLTTCTHTNNTGDYVLGLIEPGQYTITATTYLPNAQSVCTESVFEIGLDITKDTTGVDFIFCAMEESDLQVDLYCGPARPWFEFNASARVRNNGIWPADTSILTLQISPYINNPVFSPPAFSYDPITHVATWKIPKLAIFQQFEIYLSGVNTAELDDTLLMQAAVTSLYTPDTHLENNTSDCSNLVTGSYDPNDKLVYPIGASETGNISIADSLLTYTIRFQNTGTDTAFTVIVRDTLNTEVFDLSSFTPLYSSHPYFLDLEGGNILVFTFDPIFLPDSNRSVTGSTGFVMFSIKLKDNLPTGTRIANTAAIYFDYNEPVITNETENTLVKINQLISAPLEITLVPNPAVDQAVFSIQKMEGLEWADISLLSMDGVITHHFKIDAFEEGFTSKSIDTKQLSSGIYFLLVRSNLGQTSKKLVVIRNE